MRRKSGLESASGLRPASAFVVIAGVLLAVTGKAAHIAFVSDGGQPDEHRRIESPWPRFEIVDRVGRPLAVSVECFDLTVSPRSMWLSHTPDRMVRRIASVLESSNPIELYQQMLPPAADGGSDPTGLLRVAEPELLRFTGDVALRVDDWIQTGSLVPGEGAGVIDGIWLTPVEEGLWTLEWEPAILLSGETRSKHLHESHVRRPEVWTGRLLRDLAELVDPGMFPSKVAEALTELDGATRRRAIRDRIWAELVPCTFRVVARRIDPLVAHRLHELLREEAVSPWQMQLAPRLDRRHPVRPRDASVVAEIEHPGDGARPRSRDAFAILGHWGVLGREDALARARRERDKSPHVLDWEGGADPLERRAYELQTEWRPWSGLELLCANELALERWSHLLASGGRTYERRQRTVARDRRFGWKDSHAPDYFESATDAIDVPRFVSTIDASLQESMHVELNGVLERFDPALAMAIAVEVETGDVLAVDAVHAYGTSGFAPVRHKFTPGSTLKPVIMAVALDRGLVRRDEIFPTFAPVGISVGGRNIREALGAPKEAHVSAEWGIAKSVNAVLVQVGLRIPADHLRDRLTAFGYGTRPGIGLGPETAGYVAALKRGTWSRKFTHASVCFGHEIEVSLWQHAEAMAAIARGGERLPLRLVRSVEQGSRRWELPLPEGSPVLSVDACETVMSMLATGAREGTGSRVAGPESCPEFAYIGTKTGTTEKVETELCLHVELAHNVRHHEEGTSCSKSCRRSLVGARDHKGIRETCYTSSMCAIGRVDEDGPEILVFLVVEDARAKERYGADVAGRAAIQILRRAHGLAREPVAETARDSEEANDPAPAFDTHAFSAQELPWAEEGDQR